MQLIELQCFMPSVVCAGLAEKTYIKLDIYERYEKMSFRNSYTLVGANGVARLSVPLVNGRNQRIPYSTVRIDNSQRWQQLHWKTIVSAYNRSPWFEFYQLDLKPLYEQPYEHLVEWNLAGLKWVLKQLKWKGEMEVVETPLEKFENTNSNIDLSVCHDLRTVFAPRNISGRLPHMMKYNQVFEDRLGFIPYTSILDLLFCEGPNAKNILHQQYIQTAEIWENLGSKIFIKKS